MEFRYKESAAIPEREFEETAAALDPYLTELKEIYDSDDHDAPEASLCLANDQELLNSTMEMLVKHNTHQLRFIFLVGIGGSNLGAKAVYDALRGTMDPYAADVQPKLVCIDTVSPALLQAIGRMIETGIQDPEEFLVTIVSKSGTTLETIDNAELLCGALQKKFGDVSDRIVVITDEGSKLEEWAREAGSGVLNIPRAVGGRFSVLSPAGLFPLGLCGFNIEDILHGADSQNAASFMNDAKSSAALESAVAHFLNFKNGKIISDHFFFAPELESVGKWCKQLIAESLGKEKDIEGNIVNAGIFPTVSIGSADLHSMLQLYLGGPKNRYTTFVTARHGTDISVPDEKLFGFLDAHIQNKPAGEILEAIYAGVRASYADEKLPFSEIVLGSISEYSLGGFLQFKMIETMLLGKLMNIDAFDQPAVEAYKSETRRILNS
jgi:glucose-6-phosphate isomerase